MLKRDEIANPDSCLNRAAADEPVFVLRANDPCAPGVVRAWANAYAYQKKGFKAMDPRETKKHNEALESAQAMENYRRRKNVVEPPDAA